MTISSISQYDDTVTFRRGDGWDEFVNGSRYNTLLLEGYEPNEVTISKASDGSYVITFAGTEDRIDVVRYYAGWNSGYVYGVDEIRFASGTIWDQATINAMASANVLEGNTFTAATEASQIISRPESELPPAIVEDAPTQVFRGGGGDDSITTVYNYGIGRG